MIRRAIHEATLRTGTAAGVALFAIMLLPAGLVTTDARADVFNIEIDYMVDDGIGGHSHRPNDEEIQAVVQMFACQGHTLNIEVDDDIGHYSLIVADPNDCSVLFDYSGASSSFGHLKQENFDHAGEAGWHYCIFAHMFMDYTCMASDASGVAEIGGDDFIVSLGTFDGDIGTPWDRAATLAHEFGHNLGLYHCGAAHPCGDPDVDPDTIGPRPLNLPSVMSYFYQLRGVRANLECQGLVYEELSLFKNLDYSHGTMCTLNEAVLDEDRGAGLRGVDWDCDGTIGGVVAHDLNEDSGGWCGAVSGLQTLQDFDEWANIHDSTRERSARLDNLPVSQCVTAREMDAYERQRGVCAQPPAVPESCIPGRMIYLDPDASAGGDGRCVSPYDTVQGAHDDAEPGSMLLLAPGAYYESGPVILDSPMSLISTGTAIIR